MEYKLNNNEGFLIKKDGKTVDVMNLAESQVGEVYDISANHADTKYADLTAALGTNGANVPQALRKGGMSVKFVLSSDNKYVQYRYMGTSTAAADFTNTVNWQGVDNTLYIESPNLVESKGIVKSIFNTVGGDFSIDISNFVSGYYYNSDGVLHYTETYSYLPPIDIFSYVGAKLLLHGYAQIAAYICIVDSSENVRSYQINGDLELTIQTGDVKLLICNKFSEIASPSYKIIKDDITRILLKASICEQELSSSDLDLADENDNVLARFANGHIQTKNFDSSNIKEENLSVELLEKINKNEIYGKKIYFLGDSITYGIGVSTSQIYLNVLATETGCISVNGGIAATGLCTNMLNGASANRFVTRATAANLSDVDMVVIFGGTNDFSYDSKAIGALFEEETITPSVYIGDKRLIPPSDTDAFAGALHELINTIRGITDVPILYITPLHRTEYSSGRPSSADCNINGDYLIDYVKAIKEICAFYSVPVLDLYSVFNLDFTDASMAQTYSTDGLHPNANGHLVIEKLLKKFIYNNIIF